MSSIIVAASGSIRFTLLATLIGVGLGWWTARRACPVASGANPHSPEHSLASADQKTAAVPSQRALPNLAKEAPPPEAACPTAGTIARFDSTHYVIRRQALAELATCIERRFPFGHSWDSYFSMKNERPAGFKIFRMMPGSWPDLLGIQNYDLIKTINGLPLNGKVPAKALERAVRLVKSNKPALISLTLERQGRLIAMNYFIF